MKKSKVLISLISVILIIPSCQGHNSDSGDDKNHYFEIDETSSDFFKDGVSEYKIVMPESTSEYTKNAKDELIRITNEATGYTLPIETTAVSSHTADQKYISIGDTELFKSTDLSKKKTDLKRNGSKIITKDNNIYVFGSDDAGVLYGVYNLLNIYFNFETYTSTNHYVDKGVKDLKFKSITGIDNPDIEYRQRRGLLNPITTKTDDKMFAYRMRALDGYGNMLLPIHVGDTKESSYRQEHNSFYYFPENVYAQTHPNFYGGTGQLCFTAHGDKDELKQMMTIAAEKIEKCLTFYPTEQYPEYVAVQLGINDNGNNSMCTCAACKEFKSKHNEAQSAAVIYFLKEVGKQVNKWMSLEENAQYRRDLSYCFLAYQDTLNPPFDEPENIADDIKLHEGDPTIMPFVALSGSDLTRNVSDSENSKCRGYIEKWGKAYPGAWAWSYGGFFNDYLTFFDVMSFYSDYHSYLKKYNYKFTFEQVIDMQRGGTTAFFSLADYVLFKKAWNSSLNNEDLIDNYLINVYGSAYKLMKEMYTNWRLWFAKNQLEMKWGEGINGKSSTGDWFEIGFLKKMLSIYEQAKEAIGIYQDDPDTYQKYESAIDVEYIAIARPAITYFSNSFTSDELSNMKSRLKNIITTCGMTRDGESTYISSYVNSLE